MPPREKKRKAAAESSLARVLPLLSRQELEGLLLSAEKKLPSVAEEAEALFIKVRALRGATPRRALRGATPRHTLGALGLALA